MVELLLRLTAAPGRSHQLVEALNPHVRQATHSPGCRAAHLAADVEHAGVFWYCEEWDDTAALEGKLRGDQFLQLLALMETSADEPRLEFRIVTEVAGLDYVSSVRTGPLHRHEV